MATSEGGGNQGEQDTVELARRELATRSVSPADCPALLRRAVGMLSAVQTLLDALSPSEIRNAVSRAHRGAELPDPEAPHWRVYGERHRVLAEVFATQRSTFAHAAGLVLDDPAPPSDRGQPA